MFTTHKINIIAPNIKNGGGKELLEYLLIHLEKEYKTTQVIVYVDSSLINIDETDNRVVVKFSSVFSKIKLFSKRIDSSIYFGNLPPLVKSSNSIVYFHNPYLIMGIKNLFSQSIRLAFKYSLQQIYLYYFLKNVDLVACQNSTIKNSFVDKYNHGNVELFPFYRSCPKQKNLFNKVYDFCYISLAHPHKNHYLLFEALEVLGKKGLSFSVIVTIEDTKKDLIKKLTYINSLYDVRIINVGSISKSAVCEIYQKTKCLIFPSTYETFGLGLVEAAEAGLYVIAANLSYTHEIISTPYLFDPKSALSCAGTIERYLNATFPSKCSKNIENKVDELINKIIRNSKV
jgi:glycosyltransferase involved in cell wall biosynthesis